MQDHVSFSIQPLSEQSLVIQFEPGINDGILSRVLSYRDALLENKFAGLIEVVPSYCSITVYYDLIQVIGSNLQGDSAFDKVKSYLQSLKVEFKKSILNFTAHAIPVCYDLKCGLDLPELSKTLELDIDEIIDHHTRTEYTVYLIGFIPGFPYMGILSDELECSRKSSPRKKVPQGSVAIAGKQTGIYPFESPGGWQIIGQTPVNLFSVNKSQPGLFKSGDKVKFESISYKEFQSLNS